MIEGHVFIATSVDGFIARSDHALDWLERQPVAGEDHGYDAFVARMDGIVMGSESFRKVSSFDEWPYALPVIVMSSSLTDADIPASLQDKIHLSNETPRALMSRLEDDGWQAVYVDGGAVIRSFLREGLISEMTITRVPVLLGEGRALFGPLEADLDLKLLSTTTYPSGLVSTRYSLVRET